MDSSDGSFAWTDASNDTIDSGNMVKDKMNKLHSEDESVSGKSYKKKLQEELFAQSNGIIKSEKQLKPKERKRKLTENENASPKKNKIKMEPESDFDVSATNYMKNGQHSDPHESYDESYLLLKVKAEQESPDKVKKNRSRTLSNSHLLEEASEIIYKKSKSKSERLSSKETDLEDDKLNQLVQEESENYKRKAKKKKKKHKKRKDSTISDEPRHQESYMEGEDVEDECQGPAQSTDEADPIVDTIQADTYVHTKVKKNINTSQSSTEDLADSREESTGRQMQQIDYGNKSVSFNILNEHGNRTPKISERIQFEEDESSEHDYSQLVNEKISNKSSKLKKFLKNNLNLKPFTSNLNPDSALTVNDDIWIVRCPKDLDIDAFQNREFTLEGKCKLKLNGQTYEGLVDNESANMSILSLEQRNFVIRSLSVNGYINLRKRIPKSHIRDEAMASSQTNFIPLPETKCRHPLFGSDYRKAIKLSASVAARLMPRPSRPDSSPDRSIKPEAETDQLLFSKKKKKKRKHLDSEEIVPKKKKRIKHDLESAEAWESEQAIEENLFNY